MNFLNIPQESRSNLPEMTVVYRNQLELEKPVKATGDKFTIKSARAYLFDALAEALKQNLLGSDINMEFLVLSLRVYLIQMKSFSVSYPQNIINNNKSTKRIGRHNILNVRIFNNPLELILQ